MTQLTLISNRSLLLFFLFSIFFLFSAKNAFALGNTYYVDKNSVGGVCSDTNPGTITQPFCTSIKLLKVIGAGDTGYFRQAVYPSIEITKSGTAANKIVFSAYPGEIAKVDVATGRGKDGIYANNIQYVEVKNFEVVNAKGQFKAGIRFNQGGNNIISNNKVHHNAGSSNNIDGIFVYDSPNNVILNNEVYANRASGIHVASASVPGTNNQIIGNTVYANTGLGGDSDGIKVDGAVTVGTLIKDNIVYGNSDDGIDTWTSNGNTVEGNVVYDQNGIGDGNGFKMGGDDSGGNNLIRFNISYNNKLNGFDSNGSGSNVYYHNVAFDNGNYGFEDGWRNSNAAGCPSTPQCWGTFKNNIGYNNGLGNFSAGPQTHTSDYNLWFTTGLGAQVVYAQSAPYSSLAAFTVASGGLDQNSLALEPEFVNALGADFHLQSTSPAIEAGDPTNPAGVTVCGTNPDIGRFENCP